MINDSKSENSVSLGPDRCKSLSWESRNSPSQTAIVHVNQRPGYNSLVGWDIPHYDLAVVVHTDQCKRKDLLYTCYTPDQALCNNQISRDMLMGVRTRYNPW